MKTMWKALTDLIQETQTDLEKADGGNKAAAQRVRKSIKQMQLILKELRAKSLEKGDTNE